MINIKDRELKMNASGCIDTTAYKAIKKVDEENERHKRVLQMIFYICELAGFRVKGRIVLEDKKSGRIWR